MRAFYFTLPVIAALSVVAVERDASACGGCFVGESVTVVTDHRMILSISKDRSTLYDQIRYQGDPASFAWVLPIAGTVDVGLSADIVFSALDQQTQTRILPPPRNCPPFPSECFSSPNAGATSDAGASAGGGVQVLKQETVGPYETVQLAADDPNALANWLAGNGFVIPNDVEPIIDQYLGEKFNFLALKLVPGKGVNDMRPVRVTTTGAGAVLPLRMVAAGTGPVVGISLWVIGEGRYEPQNFQSFVIDTNELAWDWTQNKSNYTELRAQKTAAGNGRIWEIESSTATYPGTIAQTIRYGTFPSQPPYPTTDEERAAVDYLAETDSQGNVTKTAAQVRNEDLDALFGGATALTRITRLRADLAHASLDQDLQLSASSNQAEIPATRQLTKELNQPQCPVWNGCTPVGNAPRDEAKARSTPPSSATGSSCAATPSANATLFGTSLFVVASALARWARRRRQ